MFTKCRACLSVSDDMKFISDDSTEEKRIISMFTSVAKFEVRIRIFSHCIKIFSIVVGKKRQNRPIFMQSMFERPRTSLFISEKVRGEQ